jgi:hypothetical protein
VDILDELLNGFAGVEKAEDAEARSGAGTDRLPTLYRGDEITCGAVPTRQDSSPFVQMKALFIRYVHATLTMVYRYDGDNN